MAHELTTGSEIWSQTGGRVDAFVSVVGSAETYTGVSRYLKIMPKFTFQTLDEWIGASDKKAVYYKKMLAQKEAVGILLTQMSALNY